MKPSCGPASTKDADAIDKTLARLDTDYIDLLLIHQPAGDYVAGYRQMEKKPQEGKVRAIGLSISTLNRWKNLLHLRGAAPQFCRPRFTLTTKEPELKAYLKRMAWSFQAWYPLGHADKAY